MPALAARSKAIKKEDKENHLKRDLFNAKESLQKKDDKHAKKVAYNKKEARRVEREAYPLKSRNERTSKFNAQCEMKNKFVRKEKSEKDG